MAKLKLTGKQLRAIGLPEGPVIIIAMNIMEKNYKYHTQGEALDILRNIVSSPAEYINDEVLGMIAQQLVPRVPSEIRIHLWILIGIQISYYFECLAMNEAFKSSLHTICDVI